jgi:uncharacterized protein (TIGR03083 family)
MIETARLYAPLHSHLMELLTGLTSEDWSRPTVCRGWSVQDIAAHILDTQIRILSMGRDGYMPPPPDRAIDSYASLVDFLNSLNSGWVKAARRMSPRMLTSLLSVTGPELAEHVMSLDPQATALFPVAWAGESQSLNWFDIGRNYTEYWHHQQQIRDAVGAPPLTSREWLHPVLALFLYALPRAYEGVLADASSVQIVVTGEAGGLWALKQNSPGMWTLQIGPADSGDVAIELTDDTAWRFLTKGMTPDEARPKIRSTPANHPLLEQFLRARAVMA